MSVWVYFCVFGGRVERFLGDIKVLRFGRNGVEKYFFLFMDGVISDESEVMVEEILGKSDCLIICIVF